MSEREKEETINAIKHIRGVLSVKPHVADFSDAIATERVRAELQEKLWDVLRDKK